MKATLSTPQWAVDLVTQVCRDYNRSLPKKLQWYRSSSSRWSSGFTYYNGSKIHITAGSDEYDQELVLLHELTHHIVSKTRKGKRESHSIRFWRLAFELYERYGIELGYAYYREEGYKAKATWAYQEVLAKKKETP